MKIIAFGASYSKNSINKKFAAYAASQFNNIEAEVLDLTDYWLPLFTTDVEAEVGHPGEVTDFLSKLEEADLLIISLSEHNGSYATAFKNLFDWASRVKLKMFEGKKVLLLATAPGARGGMSVLEAAKQRFPIHGAEIIGSFSLPNFHDNFSEESGILHTELKASFQHILSSIKLKYNPSLTYERNPHLQ